MDVEDDLLSLFTDAAPAANSEAPDDLDIETLDVLLWPLLPLWGIRAATFQGGLLALGTIIAVDQTIRKPHQLLYVLQYDDGDLEHLDTPEAAAAGELALATPGGRRTLRRHDADAHLLRLGYPRWPLPL